MAIITMFDNANLNDARCMQHPNKRSIRGVTQFYENAIKDILASYETNIEINYSKILK